MEDERNALDRFLAPTVEQQNQFREKARRYGYYLIICVLSLVSLVVIPFISGSLEDGDFSLYFPKTGPAWVVYWTLRVATVALNLAIFGLFKGQAKVNSQKHPNYIAAEEILHRHYKKYVHDPRSPSKMAAETWIKKSVTITATTIASTVVISSLVLTFDTMTFLSIIVSVVTALIFSYITMRRDEIYWTDEYYQYALEIEKKEENK